MATNAQDRLVAGTPPGGGLDRVARALANASAETRLLEVPIEVVNIPGDGARRAWSHWTNTRRRARTADQFTQPHERLSRRSRKFRSRPLYADRDVGHRIHRFCGAHRFAIKTGANLLHSLGNHAGGVTVALSTALGNPNHVAFAKLAQQAGADINAPRIRVFDTALDAVADVVAGSADVAAVTAASVLAELNAGRLRLLAISSPARLPAPFADTPTWKEQWADCVIGAWRGVTGPAGLTADQVRFWEGILRTATEQPVWHEELKRLCWSPMHRQGEELLGYLESERSEFAAVLGGLGLLKRQA